MPPAACGFAFARRREGAKPRAAKCNLVQESSMPRRDDDDDDDRDLDDDDDDDRPRKKKKGGLKDEEKQMAMFCHLGALIGGFVIPLVIWMMKKDESRFVDRHGKECLNFTISLFIYGPSQKFCNMVLTQLA
jgi:hypothetical protein